MNDYSDSAVKYVIESILHYTKEDAERAKHVAKTLASLDWHQVIIDQHQEEINSQMWNMQNFIEWRENGGGFCDNCEFTKRVNYVGNYHHGPQYLRVYSWPHDISPYHYLSSKNTCGQKYCWQCFNKMQQEAELRLVQEYKKKHPEMSKEVLRWRRKMTCCEGCHRLIPEESAYQPQHRKKINSQPEIYVSFYEYSVPGVYCIHCAEQAISLQFITCQICEKKTADAINGCCYDCHPMAKALSGQVSMHLGRARKANTPATLTVKQWSQIVSYFNGKCAYCQSRPFQVLEHFLPISSGGGTTEDNCVPACQQCNSKKGSVPLDRLSTIFPQHMIDRIQNYLTGEKSMIKTHVTHNRALLVI